ncbi:uncharacterized protein K489DRAFT_252617 [Dissoconium aciculare CBS 342.82]|uniref:Uncharacterized protein n=1 Tax=Dissoconium aciculare CBS 342.82 TaxID=1314786 RepID=A0A6J3M0U3_9PEZI|nr:uncharacterized protein K489DRAFT_252617 [Dissoconium aciculare CBS 342.82]KAF1821641.1 hypothetical protein K489DRAFT_252617 [Dissoconium aciculare CBS 342.82]
MNLLCTASPLLRRTRAATIPPLPLLQWRIKRERVCTTCSKVIVAFQLSAAMKASSVFCLLSPTNGDSPPSRLSSPHPIAMTRAQAKLSFITLCTMPVSRCTRASARTEGGGSSWASSSSSDCTRLNLVMIMISGVKTNRGRQHSLALCATLENAYHIISLLTIDDRRHRPSRALSQGPMLHVNLSFFGMRDRTTTTRHVERSWGM